MKRLTLILAVIMTFGLSGVAVACHNKPPEGQGSDTQDTTTTVTTVDATPPVIDDAPATIEQAPAVEQPDQPQQNVDTTFQGKQLFE